MNAEIFAVAISNILFGFVAGLAVEAFSSKFQIDALKSCLQSTVDTMFQKDKMIDKLNSELSTVRTQYSELYDATETSRRAFDKIKHLQPPCSPLMRCEHYTEHTSVPDFPNPATPTPCATGSKD